MNGGAFFEYIDVWSSEASWGANPPPIDGDFVVVPSTQNIVIDVETAILKMLLIDGKFKIMFPSILYILLLNCCIQ